MHLIFISEFTCLYNCTLTVHYIEYVHYTLLTVFSLIYIVGNINTNCVAAV